MSGKRHSGKRNERQRGRQPNSSSTTRSSVRQLEEAALVSQDQFRRQQEEQRRQQEEQRRRQNEQLQQAGADLRSSGTANPLRVRQRKGVEQSGGGGNDVLPPAGPAGSGAPHPFAVGDDVSIVIDDSQAGGEVKGENSAHRGEANELAAAVVRSRVAQQQAEKERNGNQQERLGGKAAAQKSLPEIEADRLRAMIGRSGIEQNAENGGEGKGDPPSSIGPNRDRAFSESVPPGGAGLNRQSHNSSQLSSASSEAIESKTRCCSRRKEAESTFRVPVRETDVFGFAVRLRGEGGSLMTDVNPLFRRSGPTGGTGPSLETVGEAVGGGEHNGLTVIARRTVEYGTVPSTASGATAESMPEEPAVTTPLWRVVRPSWCPPWLFSALERASLVARYVPSRTVTWMATFYGINKLSSAVVGVSPPFKTLLRANPYFFLFAAAAPGMLLDASSRSQGWRILRCSRYGDIPRQATYFSSQLAIKGAGYSAALLSLAAFLGDTSLALELLTPALALGLTVGAVHTLKASPTSVRMPELLELYRRIEQRQDAHGRVYFDIHAEDVRVLAAIVKNGVLLKNLTKGQGRCGLRWRTPGDMVTNITIPGWWDILKRALLAIFIAGDLQELWGMVAEGYVPIMLSLVALSILPYFFQPTSRLGQMRKLFDPLFDTIKMTTRWAIVLYTLTSAMNQVLYEEVAPQQFVLTPIAIGMAALAFILSGTQTLAYSFFPTSPSGLGFSKELQDKILRTCMQPFLRADGSLDEARLAQVLDAHQDEILRFQAWQVPPRTWIRPTWKAILKSALPPAVLFAFAFSAYKKAGLGANFERPAKKIIFDQPLVTGSCSATDGLAEQFVYALSGLKLNYENVRFLQARLRVAKDVVVELNSPKRWKCFTEEGQKIYLMNMPLPPESLEEELRKIQIKGPEGDFTYSVELDVDDSFGEKLAQVVCDLHTRIGVDFTAQGHVVRNVKESGPLFDAPQLKVLGLKSYYIRLVVDPAEVQVEAGSGGFEPVVGLPGVVQAGPFSDDEAASKALDGVQGRIQLAGTDSLRLFVDKNPDFQRSTNVTIAEQYQPVGQPVADFKANPVKRNVDESGPLWHNPHVDVAGLRSGFFLELNVKPNQLALQSEDFAPVPGLPGTYRSKHFDNNDQANVALANITATLKQAGPIQVEMVAAENATFSEVLPVPVPAADYPVGVTTAELSCDSEVHRNIDEKGTLLKDPRLQVKGWSSYFVRIESDPDALSISPGSGGFQPVPGLPGVFEAGPFESDMEADAALTKVQGTLNQTGSVNVTLTVSGDERFQNASSVSVSSQCLPIGQAVVDLKCHSKTPGWQGRETPLFGSGQIKILGLPGPFKLGVKAPVTQAPEGFTSKGDNEYITQAAFNQTGLVSVLWNVQGANPSPGNYSMGFQVYNAKGEEVGNSGTSCIWWNREINQRLECDQRYNLVIWQEPFFSHVDLKGDGPDSSYFQLQTGADVNVTGSGFMPDPGRPGVFRSVDSWTDGELGQALNQITGTLTEVGAAANVSLWSFGHNESWAQPVRVAETCRPHGIAIRAACYPDVQGQVDVPIKFLADNFFLYITDRTFVEKNFSGGFILSKGLDFIGPEGEWVDKGNKNYQFIDSFNAQNFFSPYLNVSVLPNRPGPDAMTIYYTQDNKTIGWGQCHGNTTYKAPFPTKPSLLRHERCHVLNNGGGETKDCSTILGEKHAPLPQPSKAAPYIELGAFSDTSAQESKVSSKANSLVRRGDFSPSTRLRGGRAEADGVPLTSMLFVFSTLLTYYQVRTSEKPQRLSLAALKGLREELGTRGKRLPWLLQKMPRLQQFFKEFDRHIGRLEQPYKGSVFIVDNGTFWAPHQNETAEYDYHCFVEGRWTEASIRKTFLTVLLQESAAFVEQWGERVHLDALNISSGSSSGRNKKTAAKLRNQRETAKAFVKAKELVGTLPDSLEQYELPDPPFLLTALAIKSWLSDTSTSILENTKVFCSRMVDALPFRGQHQQGVHHQSHEGVRMPEPV